MNRSIHELLQMCHDLASDPRRVVGGGGNASVKHGGTMFIKASGTQMSTLTERDVVAVRLDAVRAVLARTDWPADRAAKEDAVVQALLDTRVAPTPGGPRPSVETVLHAALPWRYVFHVHPVDVNALACSRQGRQRAAALFNAPGIRGLWIDYCDPGLTLGVRIHQEVAACSASASAPGGTHKPRRGAEDSTHKRLMGATHSESPASQRLEAPLTGRPPALPNVLILANHGLLVGADRLAEVGPLVRKVERLAAAQHRCRIPRRAPSAEQRARARLIAPAIRGAFDVPTTVLYDARPALLALTADEAGRRLATAGPISPDQIVYAGLAPAWVDLDPSAGGRKIGTAQSPFPLMGEGRGGGARNSAQSPPSLPSPTRGEGDVQRYPFPGPPAAGTTPLHLVAPVRHAIERYRAQYKQDPRIVLVCGVGAFATGRTPAHARSARDVYWSIAETVLATRALGGPRPLTRSQTAFIDNWGAEKYRRALHLSPHAARRAEERIVLITGAGRGVGAGLAQALADHGARVLCADIQPDAVERLAAAIREQHGPDAALPVVADCTDAAQMAAAVNVAVEAFGGLDVLISNAGILRSAKVTEFDPAAWRKIIDVNLTGYFVSAQAAARVMVLQRRGHIIQINSKSGKKGSKYNSAYAAAKFGGIGLTQSLALDLAEDGILVNCVCPGNFFDLPLWQAPGGLLDQYRTKHGATSRDEVLRRYLAQIPLGRGAQVADLVKTILYILDQPYETGQAYNLTGGQEMR